MNAPHPIRAQFGHLAVVGPNPEPLPSMSDAIGRLASSLAILDQIAESAMIAADQVAYATSNGAGFRSEYLKLEDVAAKLAAVARTAEIARAQVSSKLAGVP